MFLPSLTPPSLLPSPPQLLSFGLLEHSPPFICGLSLLLVLVLAPRGFSPGTPVSPSPQKPTFLNSNSVCKVSLISALRQIHYLNEVI